MAASSIFEGEELHLSGVRDANHKGIAIVFQELNLAPNMSIAENILLGMEPRVAGTFVDRRQMHAKTRAVLDRLGIRLRSGYDRARPHDRPAADGRDRQVPGPRSAPPDPGRADLEPVRSGNAHPVPRHRRPQEGRGDDALHLPSDAGGVRRLRRRHHPARRPACADDAAERHQPGRAGAPHGRPGSGERRAGGAELRAAAHRPLRPQPDPRAAVSRRVVRPAPRRDRRPGRTCRRRPFGDGARHFRRPAPRCRRDHARRQAGADRPAAQRHAPRHRAGTRGSQAAGSGARPRRRHQPVACRHQPDVPRRDDRFRRGAHASSTATSTASASRRPPPNSSSAC